MTGDSIEGGSPESFFYINGICSTRRMASDTGKELSQMFDRPVTVVHNPTDSALIDIVECIFAKLWAGQSFATSKPCSLLLGQLLEALNDPMKTKVSFHCYSVCFFFKLRSLGLSLSLFCLPVGRSNASVWMETNVDPYTCLAKVLMHWLLAVLLVLYLPVSTCSASLWFTLGVAVLGCPSPDPAVLSPLQVVLIAHSQGTIIAGDVLCRLQKSVEDGELDQVRNTLVPSLLRSTC